MNDKEKKEYKKNFEFQEDLINSSEESFNKDLEFQRAGFTDDPQNIFEYKKMRLIPNAFSKFKHLDKDIKLANLKMKLPDPDFLNLMNETIIAFFDNFVNVQEVRVKVLDREGKPIPILRGGVITGYETVAVQTSVFDENLRPVLDFLEGSFKGLSVMSCAMGDEREAKLDKSNFIEKGIKRKEDNDNRRW